MGAFGFSAGIGLLLTKYATLLPLYDESYLVVGLLLAPTVGRWSLSLAIVTFPYAREIGLGRDVKEFVTWRQVAFATIIALLVSFLTAQWYGIVIMGSVILVIWIFVRFTMQRIPGLTGDIYGAICEITELVVLLLLAAKWPL